MKYLLILLLVTAWVYLLRLLSRGNLQFWKFIVGSLGVFLLLMVGVRPWLTEPLARAVAALAGLVGDATDTFTAYFKYGILFVETVQGSITLQIDFECSGIIEILAFVSLLAFFPVYEPVERLLVGVLGSGLIIVANAIRLVVICEMIHFGGTGLYYIAHTLIGRIVFYAMSVTIYFYVFTKPHILRMKVGRFTYEHH